MLEKLIDKTKDQDLLFLSAIIINIMHQGEKMEKKNSVLPELFSTMGVDNTINLIKYFGGETIKIPTHEEMYTSFLMIVCYYKKKIENKSWEDIQTDLNLDISPHTLGKIIGNIDKKLKLEIADLEPFGIDKYLGVLSKLKEKTGEVK
jgi:hypothetical protein